MKYMKHALYAMPLSAALILSGCGETEEEETTLSDEVNESDVRTTIPDLGALLVDLPSAVAGSGSATLTLQSEGEDSGGGPEQLFLMPQQFIGMADMMNGIVREVTFHLFGKAACRDTDTSNDPSDCAQYPGIVTGAITTTPTIFSIPADPEDPGAPNFVKYYKNESGDYTYTFEMYWQNASDSLYYKGMELLISKESPTTGKGKMTFFNSILPADEEDGDDGGPGTIVTSFDNTGAASSLSILLFGLNDGTDPGAPDRLGLDILIDENGILTGSGAVIRNELETAAADGMAPFEAKEEFAWVFNVAASVSDDVAIQAMAFPQVANFADSENFFTSYGVDKIIENMAISILRDNESCNIFGSFFASSGLPANICRDQTDVSDTAILTALNNHCATNTDGICASPFVDTDSWANPLYMSATGYVGNANVNTPEDASYDGLLDILNALSPYLPNDLRALEAPTTGSGLTTVE
ncbi:MAG: hypothetical protein HRU19_10610 [Pseudobacteriovorax sp.]|nr:hypothetical protein [Pseudobacteriovorax sp.]